MEMEMMGMYKYIQGNKVWMVKVVGLDGWK